MRLIGFFAALLILPEILVAAAPPRRPHVLLICVDDLKPALGCYGDALAKSPNIDRLAARGLRFDAAYCNQAVCSPSRNNLMLGSRSTSLGIYNLSTNFRAAVPDAVTLTQYFMRHGWRAEGMGKILHVGHGNTATAWSSGRNPAPPRRRPTSSSTTTSRTQARPAIWPPCNRPS